MVANNAAWIVEAKQAPLVVKEAPYPQPGPNDVIVKTTHAAVNPLDWKILYHAVIPLQYPTILGSDVAGVVVEVGSQVEKLHIGDHIVAHAHGFFNNDLARSGYQNFVRVAESGAIVVPKVLPLEKACVLPVAFTTSIAGLFHPDQLGLSMAQFGDVESRPVSHGSSLLIWGGSSSVGCLAIQLATIAGYKVVTTASPQNHGLCKELGAVSVLTHSSPTVEDEIVQALRETTVVGALDCIGDENLTIPACARILVKAGARDKKVLSVLTPTTEETAGVRTQRVMIPHLFGTKTFDVLHAWVSRAIADGTLVPKPDPRIVGKGLEAIQQGVDLSRKGVSATKLVVHIADV